MATTEGRRLCLAALLGAALLPDARAHGPGGHDPNAPVKREQKPWGIAGSAKAVQRTVQLSMGDDMRFTPSQLQVRLGETLRLVVHNRGRLMHEFVLGTRAELDAHAAMMLRFPDMEHDEPYMAHVPPGKQGQIIWTFNQPGEFEFACLIAGHFQAGMSGRIRVLPR